MSADNIKKTVDNPSEALEFLKQTFYDAQLILNPDLGFLKADNTSAFPSVPDAMAQHAQARLVECEAMLGAVNIDLWEVCMEFHVFKTHLDYAQAMVGNSKLFSEEWVDVLRNFHAEQFEGRCVPTLGSESEEEKEFRRKAHIFTLITKAHGLHPSLTHTQTRMQFDDREALLICESLLPHGWTGRINEMIQEIHGDNDFHQTHFSADYADIPDTVQNEIDNALLEFGDYDDETPMGKW